MAKRTKVEARGLKDGNKAVKTLSGAIKQVRTFWANGYKKAFAEIGITYEMMDYKKIEPLLQRNERGDIYITEPCRIKNEDGSFEMNEDGKTYKKIESNVEVRNWTVNKLFDCLKQSLNK